VIAAECAGADDCDAKSGLEHGQEGYFFAEGEGDSTASRQRA
jgi:hypothetical protein